MRDIDDIDIGEHQVAVVLHRPRNSDAHVEAVVEGGSALREFVDDRFTSLERPHAFVRVQELRE